MDQVAPCPNCGSKTLYRSREVSSGGGHGPELLPGLGRFVFPAKFAIVVCRDCGLLRFFAQAEARARLKDSNKWKAI
jgi:predicted nucleic-acid-binding Zn-ribbon protein